MSIIRGQIIVEKTQYDTYQVIAGIGDGKSILIHENTSKAQAKVIQEYIHSLIAYEGQRTRLASFLSMLDEISVQDRIAIRKILE